MKTIIDYLCPDGKFSQQNADEMCLSVKNYARAEYDLDVETGRALYRFAVLTLNYLDKECNREDFNFLSFFKLLYCEILDESFGKEKFDGLQTVYDVLISDVKDKDDILFMMSNYWYESYDELPVNADEMYHFAFGKFCDKNEIEFDESAMQKAKAYHLNDVKKEKIAEETDAPFDITMLLQFFKDFAEFRQTADEKRYHDAKDALEAFVTNNDGEVEVYNHCVQLLNEYQVFNPVLTAIKKNFVQRRF